MTNKTEIKQFNSHAELKTRRNKRVLRRDLKMDNEDACLICSGSYFLCSLAKHQKIWETIRFWYGFILLNEMASDSLPLSLSSLSKIMFIPPPNKVLRCDLFLLETFYKAIWADLICRKPQIRDLPEQVWKSLWTKTLLWKGLGQHSFTIIVIQEVTVLSYNIFLSVWLLWSQLDLCTMA